MTDPPTKTPFETKDYRISRHGALNTAVEIVRLKYECRMFNLAPLADLDAELKKTADWVLAYVETPRP